MDIAKLLNAKEGENIEFKEAKNRFDFEDLVHYACAIANLGGGKIVLGVTDKRPRRVVGSQAFSQPERTRKGLMDRLRISVDFEEEFQNGLRVLIFSIASLYSVVDVGTWSYPTCSSQSIRTKVWKV